MTARIFSDRFYEVGTRVPAWTRLGTTVVNTMTATQAFTDLGEYDTHLLPMYADAGGVKLATRTRLIVRPHVQKDGSVSYDSFGTVGPGYTIITPRDVVTALDYALSDAPVSTIGAPDEGRLFFVGYDLPGGDVAGDDVSNMLLITCPNDGRGGIKIMRVTVRLICVNGLVSRVVSESYSISHGLNVADKLARWLAEMWPREMKRSIETMAAYEQMTKRRVSDLQAAKLTDKLVRTPKAPTPTPSPADNEKRHQDWMYRVERARKEQEGINRLFRGEGVGMDTPAAAGTAWGWFNAVAEYYDHAIDKRNVSGAVADALFGQAARLKENAYQMALSAR